MISFDPTNIEVAREWILKLFKDKKYYFSAIYKESEVMWDAIIKYEDDPYASPELEEDQFDEVFSAFEDDMILVVHNFPRYLKREHFVDFPCYIAPSGASVWELRKQIISEDDFFNKWHPLVITVSKSDFNYKMYLDFRAQFSDVAYIDQKSGRTMIALSELNFLIYP